MDIELPSRAELLAATLPIEVKSRNHKGSTVVMRFANELDRDTFGDAAREILRSRRW